MLIHVEQEIGKRTAIFTSSGLAGTMFSGIMQGCEFLAESWFLVIRRLIRDSV